MVSNEDIFNLITGRTTTMVNRTLARNFRNNQLDLNMEQWSVLAALWDNNGATQQQLGEKTYREKASITKLLDKLEQQNMVVRITDKNDKRIKRIYLTRKGKLLEEQANNIVKETYTQASKNISDTEIVVCKKVLDQLYDNLKNIEINGGEA